MFTAFETLNAWVETQLATATGPSAYLLLAVGGALASLLPCVYPLYPITVSILRSRSSRLGRFAHPLAYYVGLAAIYFGFGVVASLSGGAFNEVLRLPVTNLLIGALLFVLALATIGYLHFPMLGSGFEPKDEGLFGTWLMGAVAGLLSSACVGPVVVSILVGLATGTGVITVSSTVLAATKMGAFGLGVGLPILLIGVFGLSLPRGGRWMVGVQWLFGLLIAYFALGYVGKGLAGAGLDDGAAGSVVLGAILLLGASFLLQRADLSRTDRTRNAVLVVTAAAGFLVMARAVLPAASATAPHGGRAVSSVGGEDAVERHGDLTWYLDEDAAYDAAVRSGKPVFIDFFGSWCSNCKAFEAQTQSDEVLNDALQKAVLLKIYDTSETFERYRDDPRFPELRVGLPFFLITSPSRDVLYKTTDFTKTEEMALFLSR
ncbi:MAG TPA: cytochrome c biogenesis protein CcdA [Polyangiaceae bacterium LLY-WYZ-14_1]|nr:cytochrome c biogenesis protein CcdA [Polyangiaceae bacterium LLY-WYZ-14_1]